MDRQTLLERIAAVPYWYHAIDLGNGVTTPGWAPINADAYRVPERFDGENVLDVGAWDGYWSFEAMRRGAEHVTAIDDFSDTCGGNTNADRTKAWETFDLCAEALGYKKTLNYNRYELSIDSSFLWNLGVDRAFFFGVLYHLRNPLGALSRCNSMLKSGGTIHIETAILDNLTSPYTGQPHDASGCYAEFYPTNEFGMNTSNWWVPTLKCAAAMLQAAGFVEIESWKLTDEPKSLAECRGFLKARKP